MTLKGAIIRLKPHTPQDSGSVWRVEKGNRMRYVQKALRHALDNRKTVGYLSQRVPHDSGPDIMLACVRLVVAP